MVVHRQTPWEHNKLHIIGQVIGRNEQTGNERKIESTGPKLNRPAILMKKVE